MFSGLGVTKRFWNAPLSWLYVGVTMKENICNTIQTEILQWYDNTMIQEFSPYYWPFVWGILAPSQYKGSLSRYVPMHFQFMDWSHTYTPRFNEVERGVLLKVEVLASWALSHHQNTECWLTNHCSWIISSDILHLLWTTFGSVYILKEMLSCLWIKRA